MQVTPEIHLPRRFDMAGQPHQLRIVVTQEIGKAQFINLDVTTDENGQVHHKDLAAKLIAAGEALKRLNGKDI